MITDLLPKEGEEPQRVELRGPQDVGESTAKWLKMIEYDDQVEQSSSVIK